MVKISADMISRITNLQTFQAFNYRDFRHLFFSTFAESVSWYMMIVALSWQVLEMSDSAFLIGMVWAAHSTPYLLFGVLAGAIADKVNRRNLLIWALVLQVAIALALGLLTTFGLIQIWHILFISFVHGTTSTFCTTTRQAFVVDIVGLENAMSAISMNAVAWRVMGVFGGAATGFVIEIFGIDWPYYIMIMALLVGIIVILPIQNLVNEITPKQPSTSQGIVEGIRIMGTNQIVLVLAVMAIVTEIFGFSFLVVVPIFARDVFVVGAFGLGMLTTMQSVGGLLGGLALASLGNYRHKGRLLLGIFLGFGIFLILFSNSPWYPVSLVMMVGVGAMMAALDAMQHTMLQLNVSEEQRGRAMGIWVLAYRLRSSRSCCNWSYCRSHWCSK